MLKFLIPISLLVATIVHSSKIIVSIDEQWICNTKSNCLECLSLPQCSWCNNTTSDGNPNCYSPKLKNGYCENDSIAHTDYGMSLKGNAECSCANGEMVHNCRAPNASPESPECSGRGECMCGRCVCNATPDPDSLTKVILGEFCEYDNFSCDGPDCNEGPYPLVPDVSEMRSALEAEEEPLVNEEEISTNTFI